MKSRTTDRLRLEPLEPRHASALFEGLQDERLYCWIDERRPESIDWLRRRYEKLLMRQSPDGTEIWLNWAVWLLDEKRYIGYVQATLRGNRAFVAYVLFADAWGKGFAREAVEAMIQELIKTYQISEAYATVNGQNRRSCALLINLGFEQVRNHEDADIALDSNELAFRLSIR
jgi:ribosomal-protein-alanine N-acetyltransferase